MLSSVSPVITGAEAASPQPMRPLSAAMRTSTLSARRTSSPAMITGLSIGRLTAIGSMVLIRTYFSPVSPDAAKRRPGLQKIYPAAGFRVRELRSRPGTTTRLHLLHAGLFDDVLEHGDFLVDPRPGGVGALRAHLETGLVKLVLHRLRAEHLQRLGLQPLDDLGRRLGRRQQRRVGCEHEILVARLLHRRHVRQIGPARLAGDGEAAQR